MLITGALASSEVCYADREHGRTHGASGGEERTAHRSYEARARKADGVLTWRKVGTFGGTRTGSPHPSPSFVAELQDDAPHPWRDGVRNGDKV